MNTDLKTKTLEVTNIFFNEHNADKLKDFLIEGYIQHNPHVPTGRATILEWLIPALKENGVTMKAHRAFQDGNYVVTHNAFDNAFPFGAKEVVTFDVWRYNDNGILEEHWDAIAPISPKNKSGRTQLDGSSNIENVELTGQNKKVVNDFIVKVLIERNTSIIKEYVNENVEQHHPLLSDGLKSFETELTTNTQKNEYDKLHKVLGQGNLVLAISEGKSGGLSTVFYDLFRLQQGKIAEMWNVYQTIPSEQAHRNTMFNFR